MGGVEPPEISYEYQQDFNKCISAVYRIWFDPEIAGWK
jgi:hypothetical protein